MGVVCGMWYVVCGMWYVVCGMWYVAYGIHTTYHIPQSTYHIPHTTYHIPHTKVYSFKHTWEDRTCTTSRFIGQLPRVSGEDPERIRVDSVFETSVCLFFMFFPSQLI